MGMRSAKLPRVPCTVIVRGDVKHRRRHQQVQGQGKSGKQHVSASRT